MSGMRHHGDSLYYGCKPDGSVRLLKLLPGTADPGFVPDIDTPYPETILDVTFSPGEWVEIIASCHGHWNPAASLRVLEALHSGSKLTEEMVEDFNREEGE